MNRIFKKIALSYMFCIIVSIFVVFVMSLTSFLLGSAIIGLIGLVFCVTLSLYIFFVRLAKRSEMDNYLDELGTNTAHSNIIPTIPMPAAVMRIDGIIMWYNQSFGDIFGENLFDIPIETIIKDLKWSEILKSTDDIHSDITFENRHYKVLGNLIKDADTEEFSAVLYFHDCTENEELEQKYENERIDMAIINIDNYDDLSQRLDDSKRQECLTQLDKLITEWVSQSGGFRRRTDRDRYLALFEHQYLQNYIDKKFDVIDKVRAIGESVKQPITISIGVGVGGTISQNDEYARAAIDMVLGRGGDQAAIKDSVQYKFYGSKTKEYEKSTRVKTRAFSFALKDFILHADKVILMGHKTPDYDSFGAMMGLQRAARSLGKPPYILIDNTIGIQKLIAEASTMLEYTDLFIDATTALELATDDTLLIIVDTHRPSLLACEELLSKVSKKILIDHHRRSTDFVTGCSLIYHEPYASSTCEMTTEILQYIDDGSKMNTFEAKALYVGLLMDTKNFVMKTGVRTFEAASYLRRYGVDTISVKSLFDINKEDYDHKVNIVKQSELLKNGVAISICPEKFSNVRIMSSQAADEMLSIDSVKASFVIFEEDNSVGISGRSLGDINVQVILEKLGGGGHLMVAGAKITGGISVEQVREMLISAIDEYFEEIKK